jgi:hypothetical protein
VHRDEQRVVFGGKVIRIEIDDVGVPLRQVSVPEIAVDGVEHHGPGAGEIRRFRLSQNVTLYTPGASCDRDI